MANSSNGILNKANATENDDIIYGTPGDDTITDYNGGNNEIYAGDGNDTIFLFGDDPDTYNIVEGGNGDDEIYAVTGNNYLAGGNGNDYIIGGSGDDFIDGGNGNDILTGGIGTNIYYFNSYSVSEGFGHDTIDNYSNDLGKGTDIIKIYQSANLSFSREGNDLLISIDELSSIRVVEHFSGYGVERVDCHLAVYTAEDIDRLVNVNQAPIVTGEVENGFGTQNEAFHTQFPVELFTDPEGKTLTYNVTLKDGTPLPTWLTFDPTTLTLSGIPGPDDVGTFEFLITATDPEGLSTCLDYQINIENVNDAPVAVGELDPLNILAGKNFVSHEIPLGIFTDADLIHGDSLSYSLKMADGSEVPEWIQLGPSYQGNLASISILPLLSEDYSALFDGYDLVLTATDNKGLTAEQPLHVDFTPNLTGDSIANYYLMGSTANEHFTLGTDVNQVIFYKGAGHDTVNAFSQRAGTGLFPRSVFFKGINLEEAHITGSGQDLVITYGTGDSTTLLNFFKHRMYQVDLFTFADQTLSLTSSDFSLSLADINIPLTITDPSQIPNWTGDRTYVSDQDLNLVLTAKDVKGNDRATTIISGSGNDLIEVNAGGNVIIDGGDGNDHITMTVGMTAEGEYNIPGKLIGGRGNDQLSIDFGELQGGAGNDWLEIRGMGEAYGGDGNDTLDASGAEYAYLDGGRGNDTYIFDATSNGTATISNYSQLGAFERDILILRNLSTLDVRFIQSGNNLEIEQLLNGSDSKSIITVNGFFSGIEYRVDAFQFEDGTLASQDVMRLVNSNRLDNIAHQNNEVASLVSAMAGFTSSSNLSNDLVTDNIGNPNNYLVTTSNS